jgi:glycosyltransferase involved in cell wall biosynthesis
VAQLPPIATALPVNPMQSKALAVAPVEVSIVIPVYNEQDNVIALVKEVTAAITLLNRPTELILVDDGSTDNTVAVAQGLLPTHPALRVVVLKRNFGQTAATAAGFHFAEGQIIVTLDGDLQNDPADIPALIDQLERKELDIITGWRKNRQDKALTRKLPSMIANRLIGLTTGVNIHDYGCSLKVYRAAVAKNVPLYGEMHRFIPALASIDGAKIEEVEVNHRPRVAGQSKYNLSRTFKVVMDLLTVLFMKRFFTRPLHAFGRVSMILLLCGLLSFVGLAVDKFAFGQDIGARPLLVVAALFIISALQLFSTGILAEVLMRTYYESQNKQIFTVKQILSHTSAGLPVVTAPVAAQVSQKVGATQPQSLSGNYQA